LIPDFFSKSVESQTHHNNLQELLRAKSTGETYQTLCTLLDTSKKVYYSRFGDGDLFIMMGRNQANHDYSEELAAELHDSLIIEDRQFLKGLPVNYPIEKGMTKGLFEWFYFNDELAEFIIQKISISLPVVFESSWFPNYYSVFNPSEMSAFLDRFVRPKRKMFIGSVPVEDIQKLYGKIDYYIEVPRRNAYSTIEKWWPEILGNIDSVEVVLPAAGMATRVITKRLWQLNKDVHCLDFGSVIDAVSSFAPSRKWIKLKGHVLNRILLPEYRDRSFTYKLNYAIKETGFFLRYLFYKIDPFVNIPVFPKMKRKKPGPYRRT
jgi:hypothetical protein